jgi:hypothetical protein
MVNLTQEQVRELFTYDPETGILERKKISRFGTKTPNVNNYGYLVMNVGAQSYNVGAIAWLYTYGAWPKRLKYLNQNRADNRIDNLVLNVSRADELTKKPLTQVRLKEVVHYDPKTGIFTWLAHVSPQRIGTRAGCIVHENYRAIGIDYNGYLEHRLAWLYMTGEWPEFEIDHKNRNKGDNTWENLRDATRSENGYNKPLSPLNSTGYTGVSKHGKKFRANISIDGIYTHIGVYKTIAEARMARLLYEIEAFGHCVSFDDNKDTELPSINGKTVRLMPCPLSNEDETVGSFGVYNHHGVPFWVKGVDTITGIIWASEQSEVMMVN